MAIINRSSGDWPWVVLDQARAFVRKHEKRGHPDLAKVQALADKICENEHAGDKVLRRIADELYGVLQPAVKTPALLKTLPADNRIEILKDIAGHMWKGAHAVRIPKQPATWVREPLKIQHVAEHLKPKGVGVGLSPIVPGTDSTRAALYDLDAHKGEVTWDQMQANGKALLRAARRYGVNLIPFKSSGGTGIHLLALWKTPQDSYTVRERMKQALADARLDPKTEIFPKQDSVPEGGFGNMFVLPFNGKSCPLDRRTFEDVAPENCALIYSWPLKQIDKPVIEHKPQASNVDIESLNKALKAIPNEGENSLSYDEWRNVIFAIHHATQGSDVGYDLAVEFSSRSEKFDKDFFDARVWPYIRTDRGGPVITAASIFAKAREHGYDDTIDHFEALPSDNIIPFSKPANAEPGQAKPLRFRFLGPVELLSRPEPEWIIWRVLPQAELAIIYGESTAGKSFLALDMACAIVRGIPWREQSVKQGKVGYICAEGDADFQLRIEAYCRANMIEPDDLEKLGLKILPDAPNLFIADDVKALIKSLQTIGNPSVIFIDTLARASSGANENSGEDMNRVLANCQQIHKHTGALVVPIHHSGKDLSKGARGWSGIKAGGDAEIEVVKVTEEISAANITKLKGGRAGARYPFKLNVVPLRQDAEEKVIDSCVIYHLPDAEGNDKPEGNKATGKWQKALLKSASDMQPLNGDGVLKDEVLNAAVDAEGFTDGDAKARRVALDSTKRALRDLIAKNLVRVENDRVLVGNAGGGGGE